MKTKKPLFFIKLGGSIITHKEIPMAVRQKELTSLVGQIAQAQKALPAVDFIVGHGQGSFAHVPASKYQTMNGFSSEESVLGMAIVQDAAAQLNRKVVYECIQQGLPAVTCAMSNMVVTDKRKTKVRFLTVLETYLEKGLFPVTYGDVLVDTSQGCTIWSTEEVLSFWAQEFLSQGYEIKGVVHVTEVPGFLDPDKKIIPEISVQTWPELKKMLTQTKGFDVTGGMGLKIEESLQLAEKGVVSTVLSGEGNNLYRFLVGEKFTGTQVIAE